MENKLFWKPTVESEDRKMIFDEFKRKYYGKYSGKERVMLELNLENGVGHYWNPIQILQIYSYLGLFENEDDDYDDGKTSIEHHIEFAKNMCSKYDRDLNIDYLNFEGISRKPIIYSKKRI